MPANRVVIVPIINLVIGSEQLRGLKATVSPTKSVNGKGNRLFLFSLSQEWLPAKLITVKGFNRNTRPSKSMITFAIQSKGKKLFRSGRNTGAKKVVQDENVEFTK